MPAPQWMARCATCWQITTIAIPVMLLSAAAQVATAEALSLDLSTSWIDLVSQAPIAAALAWALTLNARREKERDDVRVRLEEMHLKASESRDEVMRGLQVELGKLSGVLGSLDRTLALHGANGRNDRP